MKACDVQIGGEYTAKINKEKVPVRITAEKSGGGWSAINTATNKKVFISLARFLEPMPVATEAESPPALAEVAPVIAETTDGPATKPTRTRKPKADVEPTVAKSSLSQLDAAVKVLEEATEAMTTKAMIEVMAAKGYWTSPGGKTPHATLYSAILRELQSKGDTGRFIKTDRGHFKLRSA